MKRLMQKMASSDWRFSRRALPLIGILAVVGFQSLEVCAAGPVQAGNLMVNPTFDEGLKGWRYQYNQHGGESWWAENDKFVSVKDRVDGHINVLCLKAGYEMAMVPGQGTRVDSAPIPIIASNTVRYKLTVSAKTTAPNCRILLEGYKWKPGIKPHPNPDWFELRREYKFAQVFFTSSGKGGAKKIEPKTHGTLTGKKSEDDDEKGGSGDFGGVSGEWRTGSMMFPDPDMTELAWSKYAQVKFVCLHVVGIGSTPLAKDFKTRDDCFLYVDDIKLERIK